MKKTLILGLVGAILILSAVGMVVLSRIAITRNEQNAAKIVESLKELIPSTKPSVPDERKNTEMPCIEIEHHDFCGLIEIPAVGRELPLCSVWSPHDIEAHPHRFFGSVYDKSLIIGASDNRGQFDFLKTISIGDSVFITDVTGAKFEFSVSSISNSDNVDFEYLSSLESDLTLFAKNTYGFDYTVITCKN